MVLAARYGGHDLCYSSAPVRDTSELGSLDWSAASHAYGSAEDVPALLVALSRGDDAARADATYWLRASLLHQGSRYGASALVVPFLAGIASDAASKGRIAALGLLAELAVVDADAWVERAEPSKASHAASEAVLREAIALTALVEGADGAVRAAAWRVLSVLTGRATHTRALALAHRRDAAGVARAAALLAAALADRALGAGESREARIAAMGDREPIVSAVAAATLVGDSLRGASEAAIACVSAHVERGLGVIDGWPWHGGDVDRLLVGALARAPRDPRAIEALFAVLERGPERPIAQGRAVELARAASRVLVDRIVDRLAPHGGWRRDTAPPSLLRMVRAIVARPWLGMPELWAAMAREGLPADASALAYFSGAEIPPSVLDRALPSLPRERITGTLRTLAPALREGAGGPTLVRMVGGATLVFSPSTTARPQREARKRAARLVSALPPRDAVDALHALASEGDATLESLLPAIEAVAASEPALVLARAAELASRLAPTGPRIAFTAAGTVIAHHALVVIVALASRAAKATGVEPGEPLDVLARAALTSEALVPELASYLELLSEPRRAAWLARAAHERLATPWGESAPAGVSGALLDRVLAWVDDDDAIAPWIALASPVQLLERLSPARTLRLLDRLLVRIEAHLNERARWMRERIDGEEIAPLALLLEARGPLVVRAIAERHAAGASPLAQRLFAAVLSLHARAAVASPAKKKRARAGAKAPSGDALHELSLAVVDLVIAEPLFGHLLGRVDRILTDATPTLGLWIGRQRIALLVSPTYFVHTLSTRRQRVGALRHEVLHLLLGHPFRMDLRHADMELLGVAADLVANEHMGSWPLPSDAIVHPYTGGPTLEPHGTLDGYYAALLAHRAHDPDAWCATREPRIWHSDHRFWRRAPAEIGSEGGEFDGRGVRDASGYLDGLIDEAYRAAGKDALHGLSPGVIAMVLGAIERRRATLAWRRVLRLFAAGSRRTAVAHTLKRPSRRYGTLPGTRVRRRHRLAVAIDTSGSIGEDDLTRFFAEIRAMHRTGSELVIVECDARVQRAYAFDGSVPDVVEGRGGTSFDPVLQWLHRPDVGRFDACIYLTDGQASAPETRPPCPLLWVVTSAGRVGEHLRFGRAVQIRE